jgi:hypothetical protein
MYQLICEGKCNPAIKDVDAIAFRFSDDGRWINLAATNNREPVFRRQRALVYTDHHCHGVHATCGTCGAKRRYGQAF